jgi:hypothetical protein
VYFETGERLAPTDTDVSTDVYELGASPRGGLERPPASVSFGGPRGPSPAGRVASRDVTPSESSERPPSDEGALTESGPETTSREARRLEREAQRRQERPQGMVPGRERRRSVIERGFMRMIATGGIIGIAAILGAVLVGQDVAGWIVGLVVGATSVVLAALLWSSRQL